ncbi:MAG: hypothetical protein ACOX5R_12340 [bacterium]|jgi:hypothetical protein
MRKGLTVVLTGCCIALFCTLAPAAERVENKEAQKEYDTHEFPLVYFSDFSKSADEWKPMDPGAWDIIEDQGRKVFASLKDSNYKPEVRSPENIAILEEIVVTDFVIEAELKSTQENYGHRDMVIIFNYQDPSHYYYTHIAPAPDTDPHANSIFIVNGEPRKSIATRRNNGTAWKDDTYHRVKVERDTESGRIDVYFDDMETPILRAEDLTFTWGQVGVGSFDDTGNIASFKVWGNKKSMESKVDN